MEGDEDGQKTLLGDHNVKESAHRMISQGIDRDRSYCAGRPILQLGASLLLLIGAVTAVVFVGSGDLTKQPFADVVSSWSEELRPLTAPPLPSPAATQTQAPDRGIENMHEEVPSSSPPSPPSPSPPSPSPPAPSPPVPSLAIPTPSSEAGFHEVSDAITPPPTPTLVPEDSHTGTATPLPTEEHSREEPSGDGRPIHGFRPEYVPTGGNAEFPACDKYTDLAEIKPCKHFIAAHRMVLDREPDESELDAYVERKGKKGKYIKNDPIDQLACSEEGKQRYQEKFQKMMEIDTPIVIVRSTNYAPHDSIRYRYASALGGTQKSQLTLEEWLARRQIRVFSLQKPIKCGYQANPYLAYGPLGYHKTTNNYDTLDEEIKARNLVAGVIDVRMSNDPRKTRTANPYATFLHWIHDNNCGHQAGGYTVVPVSESIGKRCHMKDPSRLRPIYNPLDYDAIAEATEGAERDRYKLIAHSARSDIFKLREIMKKLLAMDERYHLYVAKPAYAGGTSVNLADEQLHIHSLGHLNWPAMMRELATSLACLHPSTTRESFGYIFIEPLAVGTLMLTNYVDGTAAPELFQCAGYPGETLGTWETFDPQAWADQIVKWNGMEELSKPYICERARNVNVHKNWAKELHMTCSDTRCDWHPEEVSHDPV